MDVAPGTDERVSTRKHTRAACGRNREGAASHGGERPCLAREVYRSEGRGNRMVRPATTGADSPVDRRHVAQADRTGYAGTVHALAAALAAHRAGHAVGG